MLEHKLDTEGFSNEVKELIQRQLEQYPDYRDVIENGKLNRLMSPL